MARLYASHFGVKLALFSTINDTMDIERTHFNAIEQQIRPWGINEPALLEALHRYPRHDFFDEYQNLAYVDQIIDISAAFGLPAGSKHLLSPKLEAYLIQAYVQMHMGSTHSVASNVAMIGADFGYLPYILSQWACVHVFEENQKFLVRCLAQSEKYAPSSAWTGTHMPTQNLTAEMLTNYSAVIYTGSIAQAPAFLSQLKPGTHVWAFVGASPILQLNHYEIKSDGIKISHLLETWVPRLVGETEIKVFNF